MALASAPAALALGAQPPPRPVPARPDTTRPPRDTARTNPDSAAAARADAARIDSVRGIPDSLPTRPRADSIQRALAGPELPPEIRATVPLRWTRDSLFTTGALSLTDLLERVEGTTTFRSGWLASAHTVSYLGDFRRVRVFRDGVELDFVDPRNGNLLDPLDLQLWQADEIAIERTAGEVRVHVRTWTTRNTTAYTRVDIGTGDEDTNQYRGYYGKRWGNGLALQVGAQQYGTGTRNRLGGGGDATNAMARVGWARGNWQLDGLYMRLDRTRDTTRSLDNDALLPSYDARRSEAYVRAAYRDPERGGWWAQAMAGTLSFRSQDALREPDTSTASETDSLPVDYRAPSRMQYIAAAGYRAGGLRASLTNRYRVFGGSSFHAPALRASYDLGLVGVAAFAERRGVDSTTHIDLSARVTPLRWLAVHALASRSTQPRDDEAPNDQADVFQADVAVRLSRLWLSAGLIRRSATSVVPPLVYENLDFSEVPAVADTATGVVVTARGRFYKDVYLDVVGTAWDGAGRFRPQYHTRAELGIATNWRSRFPSGNFGLRAAAINEYRSRTPFILAEGASGLSSAEICQLAASRCAPPSNALTALLEIRIQRGTLWYQLRNALNRRYELVPGLLMPRPINVYGVRWEFWG